MITLGDVFTGLEYGELASQSIAEDGIEVGDYPRIINHIQMALTAIYREFPILEKEVLLSLREGETEYYLKREYAVSNTDSSVPLEDRYISDSDLRPFSEDVLRINAAFISSGAEVPINDENSTSSVFTPSYNLVQVPWANNTDYLGLVYRANHPAIPKDTVDVAYELLVPDVLLEAILAYVASRIYYSKPTAENQAQGAALFSKYIAILTSIEFRNILHNSFNTTNINIARGGWV